MVDKGAKQGLIFKLYPFFRRLVLAASLYFSGLEGLSKTPRDEKQDHQPLNPLVSLPHILSVFYIREPRPSKEATVS